MKILFLVFIPYRSLTPNGLDQQSPSTTHTRLAQTYLETANKTIRCHYLIKENSVTHKGKVLVGIFYPTGSNLATPGVGQQNKIIWINIIEIIGLFTYDLHTFPQSSIVNQLIGLRNYNLYFFMFQMFIWSSHYYKVKFK